MSQVERKRQENKLSWGSQPFSHTHTPLRIHSNVKTRNLLSSSQKWNCYAQSPQVWQTNEKRPMSLCWTWQNHSLLPQPTAKIFIKVRLSQTSRYKWKEKRSSEIQFRRKLLPESTPKNYSEQRKAQKGGAQRVTHKTDRFQGSTEDDPNHLVVIL